MDNMSKLYITLNVISCVSLEFFFYFFILFLFCVVVFVFYELPALELYL